MPVFGYYSKVYMKFGFKMIAQASSLGLLPFVDTELCLDRVRLYYMRLQNTKL